MDRADHTGRNRRLLFTAVLLVAAAVAGALRQLWSTLWRERPPAQASQMRERAEIERRAPPVVAADEGRAFTPRRRLGAGDAASAPEQRPVWRAPLASETQADFETAPDPDATTAASAARGERLEVHR